ncbi:polyphosphate:AMP phosphotransferase [Candidatus Entotheonella palauensis]|uniref:polyphosphate:AMP phosphotransferase n=1 Tax=Candidatus Entotheonella palauensis TaxID=93172 RepID=UPI000B7E18CC|nr:polyphosphate:AMP phosphotransferase [Candidatus Entotheonella palauensis]
MFEAVEIGNTLSKGVYNAQIPDLRVNLINAQYDLREADFPVIILLAGNDRIGCNALLHTLHDVMDSRYMRTNALGRPTTEELERPRFWRYWRALPRRGQIGVFLGAWPLNAIHEYMNGKLKTAGLEYRLEHIRRFEQDLIADGALLLKFWLHLPKPVFKQRLKAAKKNPRKAWQIEAEDWQAYKVYNQAIKVAERVVRQTDTGDAPWHLVESTDARYRDVTVGQIIFDALSQRLHQPVAAPCPDLVSAMTGWDHHASPSTILDTVDLSKSLPRSDYRRQRTTYQGQLSRLSDQAAAQGLSSVLVFEGWDAAGKGGVIRRLTAAMDPEIYNVFPVAAPTPEELAHPYLWRFWRRLPRAGDVTIFDRSWYGRVLVERVEGFASDSEWQRAYSEINDFEEQLCDSGIVLLKFWLHIDPDEQLRRFQARETMPYKKYKITEEDYRNRDQRLHYEQAVHDMILRTSTEHAPWHLVPSNNKRWARIEVLKTYCQQLVQRL